MAFTIKVKEMFQEGFDDAFGCIDIVDDVCEELYIAFQGDMKLTDKGKEKFKYVLDDEVQIRTRHSLMVVLIDKYKDWEKHLELLKELFESVAGYCTAEEYEEWFKEL